MKELEFEYDGALLTGVADVDGLETAIERDGSGYPTAIVGPYKDKTQVALGDDGSLQKVTDPAGREVLFDYYAKGQLKSVTDPMGNLRTYEYDSKGRVQQIRSPTDASETYSAARAVGVLTVTVTPADGAQLNYQFKHSGPELLEAISQTDSDKQKSDGEERTNGVFKQELPGGAKISGTTVALGHWGNQARMVSEATLTTASGKELTRAYQVMLQGLPAPKQFEASINPFDFDKYETLTDVGGLMYEQSYDKTNNTITYKNSHLLKFAEETIAEGVATGSVRAGLAFPIKEGYVSVGRLVVEGVTFFGGLGAATYAVATQ